MMKIKIEKLLKKAFGGIDLTWKRLLLSAVAAGVYTAVMAILPVTRDTSFADITVTMECWILFGILIIANSRSARDAALKCFVFFLISQPLVYLIQVPFSWMGWGLFSYYRYWAVWTVLTLPMGFIGYQMKKDRWWGILILAPMLVLLGYQASSFLRSVIYWPPRHLLSLLLCLATMLASVYGIFEDRRARMIGTILDLALIAGICVSAVADPYVYKTVLMVDDGEMGVTFDDTYQVSLSGRAKGEVYITYHEGLGDYMLDAGFRRAGDATLRMDAPDGTVRSFALTVGSRSFEIEEIP